MLQLPLKAGSEVQKRGTRVWGFPKPSTPNGFMRWRVFMPLRPFSELGPSKIVTDRGLNDHLYYFGVPYYSYSRIYPKTLFYLLRPLY